MIPTVEALPAGDMHPPNKVLQLKWFDMSFHKEDRAKYLESSQHFSNEMLDSVAEYFENIFNLQVAWLPGKETRASDRATRETRNASRTAQAV
jgi:hypothetical protein